MNYHYFVVMDKIELSSMPQTRHSKPDKQKLVIMNQFCDFGGSFFVHLPPDILIKRNVKETVYKGNSWIAFHITYSWVRKTLYIVVSSTFSICGVNRT